jgi:hypothetical protein
MRLRNMNKTHHILEKKMGGVVVAILAKQKRV